MSTAELKQNLVDKLIAVTDENLLNQIESLIDNSNENNLLNWNNLSKNQQNGLINSINEMNISDGIDHQTIIEKYTKKYA